jgi:hypothetical protein
MSEDTIWTELRRVWKYQRRAIIFEAVVYTLMVGCLAGFLLCMKALFS